MSPKYFLPSFESADILVLEKKFKIDIQDGRHGGHLGFSICTILAIFNLTVTSGLQMKVSNQLAFRLRGRITKYIFKSVPGSYFGFPIGTIKIFSTYKLPYTSYEGLNQLSIPFRRRVQNIFLRWEWWWLSWISDQNKFRYFYLYIATILPTKV